MKKGIIIGCVVLLLALLATQVWAHGIGGLGGGLSGHPGGSHFSGSVSPLGGFHGSFSHPGFQGLSHFDHFQHEQFFGSHHHFGPFVPPGHEEHFEHELFFGPHHHFGGFQSDFFFSNRGFFFGRPLFPVRPQVVVIRSPFFCFPDGLEFTDQALFFDHLHQVHGIPFDQAGLFCRQVLGGRLIFFGF
jgi:hypothetical protein